MPMSIRVSSGAAKVLLPQIVPSFTNERPRESPAFPYLHQKGFLGEFHLELDSNPK